MRILIFSAHPDDAEFAMGGTLLLLAKQHDVTICTMTDGCAGTFGNAEVRREEAQVAAEFARARLLWIGKRDCTLEYTRYQAFEIASIIRAEKPDLVFAPGPSDGSYRSGKKHPDHVALGKCVRDAARFARFNIDEIQGERHTIRQLIYYMLDAHEATLAVAVDEVREQLKELWAKHATQMQLRDNNIERHLLEWRAINADQQRGTKLVECFKTEEPYILDPSMFR